MKNLRRALYGSSSYVRCVTNLCLNLFNRIRRVILLLLLSKLVYYQSREYGTSQLLGIGYEYRGLYYLEMSPSMSYVVVSSPKLLHEQLGYPNLSKLKKMVLDYLGWRQAMIDKMQAFEQNGTWELVSLPPEKMIVGCRWVDVVKVDPNGEVHNLKFNLIAKEYTQIYGLDYGDTLSSVTKINLVRFFLAFHWSLH
ncbi:hypothetical protein CR513_61836, partial [Mucuna pruriens]